MKTLDALLSTVSSNNVTTTKVVIIYRDNNNIAEEEQVIEEILDEEVDKIIKAEETIASSVLTKRGGINYFDGHKETYYNLPMKKVVSNAHNKGLEGDYWEREDGAKMLGDYIMIAANQDVHPYGSIVATSLGLGIVVDTGDFAKTNKEQIDIATNW